MPAFGALPGGSAFTGLSLLQSERIKRFRDDEDAQQLSVQHPETGTDASQVGLDEEQTNCNGYQDDAYVEPAQQLNGPSATASRRQRPASVARHCLLLRELHPARCAMTGCSLLSGSRPPYSRLMDMAAAAAQASGAATTSRAQEEAQHSAAHANGAPQVGVCAVSWVCDRIHLAPVSAPRSAAVSTPEAIALAP